jgi:imidazolonepropionase
MKQLFTNIKELVQVRETPIKKLSGNQMKELPSIKNAWLLIEDHKIANYGEMKSLPEIAVDKTIDASGKIILPSW